MNKTLLIRSLIAAVALMAPLSLFAEHHEEAEVPTLHDVWIVVPKQGMQEEFFAGVAADVALRIEGGDSREWQVYTVAIGEHPAAVQFRYCCFDWADQDAYDVEEETKGFNAHWIENVAPYIEHFHRYFEISDMENSYWPEGEGDGPYYGVTTWNLKEGAGPKVSAARAKMSQTAISGGWGEAGNNWMWLSRVGGSPKLMVVSSYENFAEMAPPEPGIVEFLNDALGAEEAGKILGDFSSSFSSSDYTVWLHQPELSMPVPEE